MIKKLTALTLCIVLAVICSACTVWVTTETNTPASAETSAENTGTASSVEPEPESTAPVGSPYADAYRSYLEVLKEYKDDILLFDWQYPNDPGQPVVFADVMGDDTPEMIFAYNVYIKPEMNAKKLSLCVVTYNGSRAIIALDYGTEASNPYTGGAGGGFFLFQREGDKALYGMITAYEFGTEDYIRFNESGTSLEPEVLFKVYDAIKYQQGAEYAYGEIDGEKISFEEADSLRDELLSNTSSLLMSSGYFSGLSFPDEAGLDTEAHPVLAMSYEEAIAFLSE